MIYLLGCNVRRQKKPARMEDIRLLLSPTLGPRACDHATVAYRRGPLPVMKVTRRPATGEESVEFAHRDIRFGLQRETAEETSEDGRDTDRDEAGDIDVDRLLLGRPDEKEDPTQHELESRAAMAGWEKIRKHLIDVVAEDAVMPLGQVCTPIYPWYWFIVKVCLNCGWNLSPAVLFLSCHSNPTL